MNFVKLLTGLSLLQNKNNKNLLLLVFGRVITGLAGSVFGFALGLYVLDLTGSAIMFSVILSASILPGIFVNILAGVFVDKHDKKKIMVTSDLISGLMVLGFLVLFSFNPKNLILFVVYAVFLSAIQSLFGLAISSAVPEFVSKDNVAKANSTFQAIGAAINIIGPIIGAIAYKTLGLKMLFGLNGVGLIMAGLVEAFLIYESVRIKASEGERKSYLEEIKFTFSYINGRRILAFFFILAAIVNLFYNPLLFLVLPYINYNIIKVTALQISLIMASGATGVIIGAMAIAIKKSLNNYLLGKFFVLFGIQAVLIILWLFPVIPAFAGMSKWIITAVFCIMLGLYGALNTAQNIPVITYFQLKIPEDIRARIFGVFITAVYISSPVGMWLYGILLERAKWYYVTFISGVIMLAISLYASRNKYFREFLLEIKNTDKEAQA